MTRSYTAALWLTFVAVVVSTAPVLGAGAESAPTPSVPEVTPEQTATTNYNAGLEYRNKAVKLDEEAMAEADAKKRAKLEKKRDGLFEKAVKRYEAAIALKSDFAQAHGSLGYALRRLGRYEEAMSSYDTALRINPNYPQAIEYRAEALLGLDRVAEAQEAYQRLTMVSPEHAAELLAAMKVWAADESNAEVADASVTDWISDQERVSSSTSSGGQGGPRSWR